MDFSRGGGRGGRGRGGFNNQERDDMMEQMMDAGMGMPQMQGMNPQFMMNQQYQNMGGSQNMPLNVCKYFQQNGNCKFGENCNFLHVMGNN